MSEAALWGYLRDHLCPANTQTPALHLERITEKLSKGVPDTTWSHPFTGRAGWLELKFLHHRRDTTSIPWTSPEQPLWLGRWARRGGGNASVLCKVGRDEWYWWRAHRDPRWIPWIQTPEAFRRPTYHHVGTTLDLDTFIDRLVEVPLDRRGFVTRD